MFFLIIIFWCVVICVANTLSFCELLWFSCLVTIRVVALHSFNVQCPVFVLAFAITCAYIFSNIISFSNVGYSE